MGLTEFAEFGILNSSFVLGVPLTSDRVDGPQTETHPVDDPIKQFDDDRCRETYVCFLKFWSNAKRCFCLGSSDPASTDAVDGIAPDSFETVAFAPSVTPETNRALQHVNPNRSGEEKQGCRNPGNGNVLDRSIPPTPRSHDKHLTKTYLLLKNGRADETRLPKSKGWRVPGGFL